MPSILYILVIYGRESVDTETMRTLFTGHTERLSHLFIYDNSPTPHMPPQGIAHYIHDPSNSGLGRAYNTACQYAKAKGYELTPFADRIINRCLNACKGCCPCDVSRGFCPCGEQPHGQPWLLRPCGG